MDGALVYDCDPLSPALGWLQRRKLPLVYVDQDPTPGVPCVNVDDRAGARTAAEHLVGLGHRKIGIVNAGVVGPTACCSAQRRGHQSFVTTERMLGWRDALLAAGIEPVMVQQQHFTEEDGFAALRLLLAAEPGRLLCCVHRTHWRTG